MSAVTRRDFLRYAGIGAAALSFPGCLEFIQKQNTASKQQINIVLILADDLGYGDIKCFNSKSRIPTPNIDALASRSVCFTDAHANAAQCSPTRYGLLTGRYSWRTRLQNGVLKHFDRPLVEKDRMTIASMLKTNGYSTACIGKWHLGLGWQVKEGQQIDPNSWDAKQLSKIDFSEPLTDSPLDHGFDYYFGLNASNNMLPYCFIENNRVVLPPTKPKEAVFDAEDASLVADDYQSEKIDQVLWHKAKGWLNQHFEKRPERPFFLYYPTSAIHRPCLAIDNYREKSMAGLRGDKVVELDSIIGGLWQEIIRHHCEKNTIIIFTSDNGAEPGDLENALKNYSKHDWGGPYKPSQLLARTGEGIFESRFLTYGQNACGPFSGYKSTIYEGGHRVPFIVYWPGTLKAGTTCDEIICMTDVMATITEIIGLAIPSSAGEDSLSFLRALQGRPIDKSKREAIILDSWYGVKAVRQDKWKLILGNNSGGWYLKNPKETAGQLYNVKEDPAETKNVYEEHPDVVKKLTALYEKYKMDGRSVPTRKTGN